jgi:hypothetical protein
MPKIRIGNRALDVRPDRIDLRDYPYRPPLVSLPDQWPPPAWIEKFLPEYAADKMVLNQGNEGACTGFGLSAVINYLKWERWKLAQLNKEPPLPHPEQVSPRMLYQNARLYDEWKGEDYEGSSCRGAMKGLLKHGVCSGKLWPYGTDKRPGGPKSGWQEDAALTPLGAYYRIETDWIVALQAAIREVHAIYVSASAHDGWDKLKAGKPTIDDAMIAPPHSKERGGHAFALVGYRSDGFIVQNSWGSDWGFQGFAILPYEDWLENGYDAWVLALGAPLARVGSKITQTVVSLSARAGSAESAFAAAIETKSVLPSRWTENEVARHALIVGSGGRPVRHLVEALDEADGVRQVVAEGIASAQAKGLAHVAIYAHGGLNSRDVGLARARNMGPWLEANGIHPIFIIWQTGFWETAKNVIDAFARNLLGLGKAPATKGLFEILRDSQDRTFELSARDLGVKAIWEDMKSRAELSNLKEGATALAARNIAKSLNGVELHLMGHSAGASLLGHFIGALRRFKVPVASCSLWAPACTVEFAIKTYGAALTDGILPAKRTLIEVLSDGNERGHYTVPLLYSKSLLYLVSRALEPDHKTPILGMEMAAPGQEKTATKLDVFDDEAQDLLKRWSALAKGVSYLPPVAAPAVPTRIVAKGSVETIDADHGSFDNSLDSFNRAVENILQKAPLRAATDLTGF